MAITVESRAANWHIPVAATAAVVTGIAAAGATLLSGYDFATHIDDNFAALNAELSNEATSAERKEALSSWRYFVEGITPQADQMQIVSLREGTGDKLAAVGTLGSLAALIFMFGRFSRRS